MVNCFIGLGVILVDAFDRAFIGVDPIEQGLL